MMLRILFLILFTVVSLFSSAQRKEDLKNSKPLYGFIENKGQVVDQDFIPNETVKYILPLPNNNVVLKSTGFSYDTYITELMDSLQDSRPKNFPIHKFDEAQKDINYKFHRVDVEFLGANPDAEIIATERSTDYAYYNTSGNGENTKVYHYGKITFKEIYPGIDLEFIARPGKNKPVEYNFIVQPGADLSNIKLHYRGANTCKLSNGKLSLKLGHGVLTETIPASYWQKSKKNVKISYERLVDRGNEITLGFKGNMNRTDQALVIDPTPNLDWGTYYGGSGGDTAQGITSDTFSNIYITGFTSSTTNIATTGAYQSTSGGGFYDVFVAKFNSAGVRQWATYYGGPDVDYGSDLAVGSDGSIYLAGYTNSLSGIATLGAHKSTTDGIHLDGIIVKFNSAGSRIWATYYGGSYSDVAAGIALDPSDNIYITGDTGSPTSIATTGSHQSVFANTPGSEFGDAYLVKFSPLGIRQWGTYYGGSGNDGAVGVVIDGSGNVLITGRTESTGSISTPNTHQTIYGGVRDCFIAKFTSMGTRQWGSYFGGGEEDFSNGITSDNAGNIFVTGLTKSASQIATAGAHQTTFGGGGKEDAFIGKFDSNGLLQWATYYGGSGYDQGWEILADISGNVVATGQTSSLAGISTIGAHQPSFGGSDDAYLVKFDGNGVRQWGTYYGGTGFDYGWSITKDNTNNVYISGPTSSTSGVVTSGGHQIINGGGIDTFVAKFSSPTSCTAPETAGLTIQDTPYICAVKFTTNKLSNCTATYSWNFGDGGTSLERNPLHVYASAGTYNVSVQISYNCPSCQSQTTLTKQVVYAVPTSIMEDRVVDIVTTQIPEVIQTSASSFSDAWPLSYSNNTLDNKNSFLNGSQGVWRNNASFVYEKERKLSPSTNIATDGTFTLEQFNWKSAELNGVPNWIKANSMTGYSPFSFELENQDVLGVYSGAIYDYGGQLPAANGVNMRHDEMAFTSFEFLDGTVAGNWIFASGSLPTYVDYKIQSGNKNMALVEASLAQLANVVAVDVVTTQTYSSTQPYKKTNYVRNEIVCIKAHPQNPAWSFVVLKTAPLEELWSGRLRVKNVVSTTGTSVFDNTIAHTGEKSLKVTSDITIKQELLQLDENKSYWISSWVSTNNAAVATPVLASNLGIDIIAKLKNGQVISTFTFQPAGPVIEGWQQLKGSFICPLNTAYIEIKFKPGSTGIAWYDDVRLHPEKGNMKGYVYNLNDYRLQAVLDEENFASFFYYDAEGNLYLTKKETVDGVKTLSENISYQVER